jgi:hypothetical protein
MANLYLSQGSGDGLRSVGAGTGELGQWWRRGARSPPAKGGDWPENGGKVLSEIGVAAGKWKMEKLAPEAGTGSWHRCWKSAGKSGGKMEEIPLLGDRRKWGRRKCGGRKCGGKMSFGTVNIG